eukprot:211742_1
MEWCLLRFICILLFLYQVRVISQHPNYPCYGSDAGWRCNYRAKYSKRNEDHFFCDLDIVPSNITWHEFESKYYFKKPVVINTTLSDWTHNVSFWSKRSLLSLFGDHEFEVGPSYEALQYAGIMQRRLKFSSYVEQLQKKNRKNKNKDLYLFDRSLFNSVSYQYIYDNILNLNNIPFFNTAHTNLKTNYDKYTPPYNFREYNSRLFSLGRTGSGVGFHDHGETFLFLIYGRKRWFLYPPNIHPVGGIKAGFSTYDWYKYIYKHLHLDYGIDGMTMYQYLTNKTFIKPRSSIFTRNNGSKLLNSASTMADILSTDYAEYNENNIYGLLFKPLECMLLEGQIMYLPESWWHQALNLGDVLSIGFQINNEYAGYHPVANWTSYYRRIYASLVNKEVLKGLNRSDLEIDALKVDRIINIQKRILYEDHPLNAVKEYLLANDICQMGHAYYSKCREHLVSAILMDPTYIYAYLTLAGTYMDYSLVGKHTLEIASKVYGYSLEMAQKVLEIAYVVNRNHEDVQKKLLQVYEMTNQMHLAPYVRKRKPLPVQ